MQMEKQYTSREFDYCDLGLIAYDKCWDLQKDIFSKRVKSEIKDTLFLLEHPHTYTLGKTANRANLIGTEEFLKQKGVSVFDIDRGGDITYHGPGQIVGYPIISLTDWKKDTHLYLRNLEEIIIMTCAEYGLETGRKEEFTGVWLGERKIAAIGIKISKWVTMHGFAFNINPDLSLFGGIVPCGITDKAVTSLSKELGREIPLSEVKGKLLNNFKKVFDYENFHEQKLDKYL
ncbi:MAG: lipoyl(octanoyl) transferase LipB [Melioribacteraceae bacterium]|nr:lipoyl(octanoyl) transferase LipB [Melioribacteraceae bacterium]